MTTADLSRFYGPDYTQPGTGGDGIGPSYANWDAYSTTACFCDQGYFGADCSKREWRYYEVARTLSIGWFAETVSLLSFARITWSTGRALRTVFIVRCTGAVTTLSARLRRMCHVIASLWDEL